MLEDENGPRKLAEVHSSCPRSGEHRVEQGVYTCASDHSRRFVEMRGEDGNLQGGTGGCDDLGAVQKGERNPGRQSSKPGVGGHGGRMMDPESSGDDPIWGRQSHFCPAW